MYKPNPTKTIHKNPEIKWLTNNKVLAPQIIKPHKIIVCAKKKANLLFFI